MASVNKVILIGNLGRDPEVRSNPDGFTVCNVSIATAFSWKDKNTGDRREETEWHRVVFFNRLAEIVGQYLKKGSSVYVEGRLRTRKYVAQDGAERQITEIVAENMTMLGGRSGGEQTSGQSYSAPSRGNSSATDATDGYSSPQGTVPKASPSATDATDGYSSPQGTVPKASPSAPSQAPARPAVPEARGGDLNDMDDDIPF